MKKESRNQELAQKVFHFRTDRKGGEKPISNIEEGDSAGKVVLLNDKSEMSKKVKVGEDWLCTILFEKEKFAVVEPIERMDFVGEVIQKADETIKRFGKK